MISTEISTCSPQSTNSKMSSTTPFNVAFSKLRVTAKSWGDVTDLPSPVPEPEVSEVVTEVPGGVPRFSVSIGSSDEKEGINLRERPVIYNINVSKFITPDIRLADSNSNINLFHWVYCDNESPDDVKACRGIIRQGDKILCKTFGYTPEVVCNSGNVREYIHSFSGCKFYDAEEGATIRLWEHEGKWNLSTHRKIDAHHSRWGNPNSKSFGDMFIDALQWDCVFGGMKDKFLLESPLLDQYTSTLDKNKVYTFLVRNDYENRIVCDADENPRAYFIGAFDRTTHFLLEGGNDSGFPTPKEHFFNSEDELINYGTGIDYRQKQGVIVYLPNQKQVKFLNWEYVKLFDARGNEPSIKFRYLQVRGSSDNVSMLYKLYPDYIPVFEMYENILSDIAFKIHQSYIDRFIKHKFVSLPQPEFFVLQACHGWYIQDRIKNKITLEKVINIVNDQSPTSLNRLIKPYLRYE